MSSFNLENIYTHAHFTNIYIHTPNQIYCLYFLEQGKSLYILKQKEYDKSFFVFDKLIMT